MAVSSFVGRRAELALLGKRLERVGTSGAGAAVAIRGRRQVGKSRLVQEFCDRAGVPYVFFTATKGASSVEAVADFLGVLAESSLPESPELVPGGAAGGWPDAFRALASALPDRPSVVVLDEVPWLAEQDDVFDGALQTAWDRLLSQRPVLLLLLGSDLHMMERLTAYDRPFYGRADNLVLGPLNPAETGTALGLPPLGRHRRAPCVRRPSRHYPRLAARHTRPDVHRGRMRRSRLTAVQHPGFGSHCRVPRSGPGAPRTGGGRQR